MNTLKFIITQRQFQVANFRKYLFELKTNKKLVKGAIRIFFMIVFILSLSLFLKSVLNTYFIYFILTLLFVFILMALYGIFSEWKDGGNIYIKHFSASETMYFHYNDSKFIYSNKPFFQNDDKCEWPDLKSVYILEDLKVLILEENNLGTFYLTFNKENKQLIMNIVKKYGIECFAI